MRFSRSSPSDWSDHVDSYRSDVVVRDANFAERFWPFGVRRDPMAATTSTTPTPRKNGFDFAALTASAGKQDSADEVARLRAALETLAEMVVAHGVMDARTLQSIVGDLITPPMVPVSLAAPLPPPAPSAAEALLRGPLPKPAPVAARPAAVKAAPTARTVAMPAPAPVAKPAPV